jgi:EmrB/QacA subfamily drug resistance transporter
MSLASPRTSAATSSSRWIALVILCAGMLMIVLDATIVNVALPSIQSDLGFSQSNLAWVVNAYLIAFGGLLLLAGRLGDLIGRKRMFLTGLTVFTAASFLCGLALSQEMLVAARFIQGVGGAMTAAVILGMIVTMFPEPADRARAIGVYSFVASSGASLGLLLSGVLTQAINWHWVFFVNIPIGVVTAILAIRLIDSDRGIGLRAGADVVGAILITSALMLGVYTIIRTTDFGWGSLHTFGFGAASIALLIAFIVRESRVRTPLLPLRVFRSRTLAGANVVQILMVAGLFGVFFLGTLYLQRVLGFDPISIGLAFLPVSVGIGFLSLVVSAPAITRFGARNVLLPSLGLIAIGLFLFSRVPVEADYVTDILPSMLLLGVGAGLVFPSLMSLAMSGATASDSGLASGLINTSQQVGGALGLAVLASLSTSRTDVLLSTGVAAPSALTGGYQLAFTIAAGLIVAAIAVAVTALRPEGAVASTVDEAQAAPAGHPRELGGTRGVSRREIRRGEASYAIDDYDREGTAFD